MINRSLIRHADWKNFFGGSWTCVLCTVKECSFALISNSQRKIRRDMLASPSLMERGRSRSREPVPQLMRRGSAGRGRSVSAESRRSRCSSDGSVAEFEELAKPLNSRQVNKTFYIV